ncbi:MAG: glycosyltransferase [Candidatus Paceibacterota bacterium]|jgi:glycosyltransferase involved in cell wall biosynthesis
MSKIFIHSCHAALEYDQALMFGRMGHQVAGNFDVGSNQRPKLPSTEVSHPYEEGLEFADMYLMHQCEDYSNVFERYCRQRGYKRPVVLINFGQGCMEQHKQVVGVLATYTNAWLVNYSKTDHNRMLKLGAPENKMEMIRFGKDLEDYRKLGGWTGRLPMAYMSCNSIMRRGGGCGWDFLKNLYEKSNIPILLGGRENEEVPFGIGEQSYASLQSMYRNARCYITLGTQPAPYVLTLVEAMCAGCPVIAFDNGCGIRDEDLGVIVAETAGDIYREVMRLCNEWNSARAYSIRMLAAANREFDLEVVAEKWEKFMERMF